MPFQNSFLKASRAASIEFSPADDPWIINSVTVAPGELLVPDGASNQTLDALAKHGVSWTGFPMARCS
jgi:hypothetical protein